MNAQDEYDLWMTELVLEDIWPRHVRGVARHSECGKIMLVETDDHRVLKPPSTGPASSDLSVTNGFNWCRYCNKSVRTADVGIEHWDGQTATKLWSHKF